jgi:hypothetical protein
MERKCNECTHKKEKGCEKWDCEFEPKYADPTEDAGTLAEQNVHCNFTDAEIAKEFIKDVKAVEGLLPRKMTNWEKFKEVFGIPADAELTPKENICNMVDCSLIMSCSKCPICNYGMDTSYFWEREYEVKKND